jgi:hypothetical protein
MAGDPAYTLILLGLGCDELSMSGTAIPMVKRIVRSSSLAEANALLAMALARTSADDIESYVRAEMSRRFPDVFAPSPSEPGPVSADALAAPASIAAMIAASTIAIPNNAINRLTTAMTLMPQIEQSKQNVI